MSIETTFSSRASSDLDTVTAARVRLRGRVRETPVIRSAELDDRAGARLWLKAENLQDGGSFKVRGALLAVGRLAAAGSRGLVAQSTGNHAIAVALAARQHALPAILVLPRDVSPYKAERIISFGASVILAGSTVAERSEQVDDVRRRLGYDVVDSYDDRDVLLGQGTATAELVDQMVAGGARPSAVVVPVGGGSALAGACLALAERAGPDLGIPGPDLGVAGPHLIGAEPAAVDSLTQALRAGRPVTIGARPTIADGLRPDRIGALPFSICRDRVTAVRTATESEIGDALCLALIEARILVEPAAATALAVALRLGRDPAYGGTDVGVLLSGGNVDLATVHQLVSGYLHDGGDA